MNIFNENKIYKELRNFNIIIYNNKGVYLYPRSDIKSPKILIPSKKLSISKFELIKKC